MACSHCGSTDSYELVDGRSRCTVCFATFETKREKTESPAVNAKTSDGDE